MDERVFVIKDGTIEADEGTENQSGLARQIIDRFAGDYDTAAETDPYAESYLLEQVAALPREEFIPFLETVAYAKDLSHIGAFTELADFLVTTAVSELQAESSESSQILTPLRVLVSWQHNVDVDSDVLRLHLVQKGVPSALFEDETETKEHSEAKLLWKILFSELSEEESRLVENLDEEVLQQICSTLSDTDLKRYLTLFYRDENTSAVGRRIAPILQADLELRAQSDPDTWMEATTEFGLYTGKQTEAIAALKENIDVIKEKKLTLLLRFLTLEPDYVEPIFLASVEEKMLKIVEDGFANNSEEYGDIMAALTNVFNTYSMNTTAQRISPDADTGVVYTLKNKLTALLADKVAPHFFDRYGYDISAQLKDIPAGDSKDGHIILKCIDSFRALIEDPEIGVEGVQTLQERFALTELYRYSTDLLKQQLKEVDEQKPYALVVTATSDHNGAFIDDESLENLMEQLNAQGYALRLTEAGSRFALAKRLLQMDKAYGEQNKISLLVVRAHGSKESMGFGDDYRTPTGQLQIKDLTNLKPENADRLNDALSEEAMVVLGSCSTGQNEGMAEGISDTFNQRRTIGPKSPTRINSFNLTFTDGTISDVHVDYGRSETGEFGV